MRADPALRSVPVAILTGSPAEQDVIKGYRLKATCYIVKPVDVEQLLAVVASVDDFWITVRVE